MVTKHEPFGRKLRDLLIAKDVTTRNGNPDWAGFCQQLDGTSYETLRKAVTGDRWPARKIIEAVSDALRVDPTTFIEYRLDRARRGFDPRVVGLNTAMANLESWAVWQQGQVGRTGES